MKAGSGKIRIPRAQKTQRHAVPALEWVRDVSGRTVRVTAVGSRRLLVENHNGILSFAEDAVCLSTACGPLTVCGKCLSLCEVRPNALIVHGCICCVTLPDDGGLH